MVTYQFEIADDEWEAWKETVPRSKSLDTRLRELIRDDEKAERDFEPLDAKNVSYGPSDRDGAAFVLRVGTEDGAVRIHLDEEEMYELWTEVQHTPWPDRHEEDEEIGRLRSELVEKAMGADAEMLRDALNEMDPHRDER
jgi:hypothetical protein